MRTISLFDDVASRFATALLGIGVICALSYLIVWLVKTTSTNELWWTIPLTLIILLRVVVGVFMFVYTIIDDYEAIKKRTQAKE
jgi:uncharacterized integral membrane protein